jgi:hypothetical protein
VHEVVLMLSHAFLPISGRIIQIVIDHGCINESKRLPSILICIQTLRQLQHWPRVGLAQYGTFLVQWYVMHSHERRLAGSMTIDDEFEVCFEFRLLVVLAKRRM